MELERRVNLFREILTSRGIDHKRVHVIATCSREGENCVERINQFYEQAVDVVAN
jgi:coenzyme F420-reducing hydrogenase delta subunit